MPPRTSSDAAGFRGCRKRIASGPDARVTTGAATRRFTMDTAGTSVLHTDLPTRDEIVHLLGVRGTCVSIYVPTTPISSQSDASRIELKNLGATALVRLRASGTDARDVEAIEAAIDDLVDDAYFWGVQANSLAVFTTPRGTRTFRLPNQLLASVAVADRFTVKPMLRAVTFPQTAFVLALAQGSVRLVEVSSDLPTETIVVEGMPTDAASAVRRSSITDRSPSGRIQGSEGQKVRLTQYARQIDVAIRPVLAGLDVPLIIAGAEPLASIFRGVCSYPHLTTEVIGGNPEEMSDQALAAASRSVLDAIYAQQLGAIRDLLETRRPMGRATTDIVDAARAATLGAVDTLLVDIDRMVPGVVDDVTGAVRFDDVADAGDQGVLDEIARRTYLTGGRVLAVRDEDIPDAAALAAILRYPV